MDTKIYELTTNRAGPLT